jgi:hypothetical protein
LELSGEKCCMWGEKVGSSQSPVGGF